LGLISERELQEERKQRTNKKQAIESKGAQGEDWKSSYNRKIL